MSESGAAEHQRGRNCQIFHWATPWSSAPIRTSKGNAVKLKQVLGLRRFANVSSLDKVLKPAVGIQRVARRTNSADNVELSAFVDRFAQAADMDVNGARFDVAVVPPDAVEQTFA